MPASVTVGEAARESRATRLRIAARERSHELAARLGTALRDARLSAGISQKEAARRCRLSQSRWSELERGRGGGARLGTWVAATTAVGIRFAAFLEAVPGSTPPRDMAHLRRQSAVIEIAVSGGWSSSAEVPVATASGGRVIDVLLERPMRREALIVEVWDLILDVGAGLRGLDAKVASVAARRPGWAVSGCWLVRGTRRNRNLVRDLGPLFAARFPGDGPALLRALRDPARPVTPGPALLWSGVTDAATVIPSRLRTRQLPANPTAR